MGYVMVPVPEEHVAEVLQLVLKLVVHQDVQDWDEDSAFEFFETLDEPSRSVLSIVARTALSGQELPEREISEMIEFSRMETAKIIFKINEDSRNLDPPRPHPLVVTRMSTVGVHAGAETQRFVGMSEDVARCFQEAERRELAAETSSTP